MILPPLKQNSFTVGAVDNMDFDGRTKVSTAALHGTSLSFHQEIGELSADRPTLQLTDQGYEIRLPDSHTMVPSIEKLSKVPVPLKRVTYPYFDWKKETEKVELC